MKAATNDVERICRSLVMLSLTELHRLRRQTLDWRVKAAVSRCIWKKQHAQDAASSSAVTQLGLFGEGIGDEH